MARQYRKFDQDFQQGAVRLVLETGKPIAQVARELGINEGTLGNWCARERRRREGGNPALSESERAELERLRTQRHPTGDANWSRPLTVFRALGRRAPVLLQYQCTGHE